MQVYAKTANGKTAKVSIPKIDYTYGVKCPDGSVGVIVKKSTALKIAEALECGFEHLSGCLYEDGRNVVGINVWPV